MSALLQRTFSDILAREQDTPSAASTPAAAGGAALVCAAIEDVAGLDAIRGDWLALEARAGGSQQLFQTFQWNRTWVQHYIERKDHACTCAIAIVTVRQAGRLVLVWPLVVQRHLGLRQLIWMGYPVTQYGDVLLDPAADAAGAVRTSWRFIVERFRPDLVSLRKVRADAAIAPYLAGIGGGAVATQGAPFLDLASANSFDAYETRYSGKARKNRRRLARRLGETGTVAFVHHGPGAEARRLAVRAVDMKRAWLDQRDMFSAAVRDPRFGDFFATYADKAGADAECRVSALTLDGAPIAIMAGLLYKGRFAGHVFAYDIAHEKSGAGVLLLEELIREGYRRGDTSLDLMSPADAYKLEWADAATDTLDWALPVSLAGRLYGTLVLSRMKEPMKRIVERMPAGWRKRLRTLVLERNCEGLHSAKEACRGHDHPEASCPAMPKSP